MKKTSVKLKITLWYVLVLTLLSFVLFYIMNSFSVKNLENATEKRLTRSVGMISKRLEDTREGMRFLRPHELFIDGVHIALYDENQKIMFGQSPFGISANFEFSNEKIRDSFYNNMEFFEYDRFVEMKNGQKIWVKGIVSLGDEIIAAREIAKYNLVFIAIMLVLAAVGGYFITTRVLRPVNKIQETAEQIIRSKNLKERINIGEGSDEFHSLANTFDKMLCEIETVLEREKQFTSDASHELRTPVAVIMSECEYMEKYGTTVDELKESAASIKMQTEKMTKLISELLAMSRMDRNTYKTEFEMLDVSELLTFICAEQEQINQRNVSLITEILPKVTAEVDKILIARLFINLISNAFKYNKENGVVKVSLQCDDNNIFFTVSDTGIGISSDNLPKIWERFYRVDEARNSDNDNSIGLGLSMVKWIAEIHNGEINVKSEEGYGTEFLLKFSKYREKK